MVRVVRGRAREGELRFTGTFTVGGDDGCDLQLLDAGVAPSHLQVMFDGKRWWARNLAPGGTYQAGTEIQMVPLQGAAELELGRGGPVLALSVAQDAGTGARPAAAPPPERPSPPMREATGRNRALAAPGEKAATAGSTASSRTGGGFTSEEQILQRLRAPKGVPAGPQTMVIRRAFAEAQRQSSRKYQAVIAAAAIVLVAAGGVIWYQKNRLAALRDSAEQLFYAAKTVELETAKLEELVLLRADPKEVAQLRERRGKLADMERQYDDFVRKLDVYAKASPQEQLVLRVARLFGECEVNVPPGFVAEVERFAARWKSTGRLAAGLQRAKQRGYAAGIARAFQASNLPAQYLFLALQESNFDERAVGPATRYGFAKGMWQFISFTGKRYGLRIGPLQGERAYDGEDERFEWQKATAAAAKYIRELTDTEAQGSGLLVMASYNWGEHNIRGIIEKLPENPQDRNFWRLLADKRVPRETYDYVLSIFSAAVICEDPKLFGFGGECPRLEGAASAPGRGT